MLASLTPTPSLTPTFSLLSLLTMTDLHTACRYGNFRAAQNLITSDAFNIDEPVEGWTPLLMSCFQNHLRIAELLVQAGASLDAQNNNGRTALMLAVSSQHAEMVELLLRAGASLEIEDKLGITPLVRAAINRDYEMMKILVEGGATVDSGQKKTALHYAAFSGEVDAFAMLVGAGAKLENPDETGRVALEIASVEGHYDVVNWMLSHTDIERCGGKSEGREALCLAAATGHVEVMQLLVEFNVSCMWDLCAALLEAMDNSNFQENSVKFLLKNYPVKVLHVINNALMKAVEGYKHGCTSSRLTRRLMDAGAKTTESVYYEESDGILQNDGTVLDMVAKLRQEETEEKHVQRLDSIHRLLRQEDAVHSLSFLWPLPAVRATPTTPTTPATPATPATPTTSSQPDTPAVVVRPVRRSREATSRVVKGALFRYARKTIGTEVAKVDLMKSCMQLKQSEAMREARKNPVYKATMARFLEGKYKW